ncbi:hypothetical protein N9842_02520 [Porticoccaceae bacterium]|nr:hypothetical protein [Porticoccaceae bacterium]MDB9952869.1 hypothetical protein [Porticoccaceae bacterium]MDB9998880.1 hypothetical protein [Porticoccaceae bacterium]
MMLISRTKILAIITSMVLLTACVSIPPEAPELSAELGNRIAKIEQSHLMLLGRFFDRKKEDVDTFIQDRWVPEFAKQFFSEPAIASVWDQIVASGSKEDRLQFILRTSPTLQQKINNKRLQLSKPLEDLEQQIATRISADYSQAKSINNSITSLLLSAADVVENRDRYLAMVGVSSDEVTQIIDSTDSIVGDLLDSANNIEDKVAAAEKYKRKLKELKASL